MDLTESIAPRSDQVNAEDLLAGPRTVTITAVTQGTAEQPVNIVTAEFGPERPYKPSKSMRRILVSAWGSDSAAYIGRRMTIYREPSITFGRDKVGGIRISNLSHLPKRLEIALTVTRGKRAPFVVDPLPDEPAKQPGALSADARAKWVGALDKLLTDPAVGESVTNLDDRNIIIGAVLKRGADNPVTDVDSIGDDELRAAVNTLKAAMDAGTLAELVDDALNMAALAEAQEGEQ